MKVDQINRWLTLLANVGVIAGILFLALELQQNNELLAAQARRDQLDARTGGANMRLDNEYIMRVEYKALSGEPLTEYEQFQLERLFFLVTSLWEWQFDEVRAGTLDAEDLPVDAWAYRFRDVPAQRSYWERGDGKRGRSPEFVQFVDQCVLRECETVATYIE